MAEHNETGIKGEELAAKFLEGLGYKVLEKNWVHKSGEVDIIAIDNITLVVAEVKTRRSNFFGEPEEWVTRVKQKNLIKVANAYVQTKNLDLEVRFDIISILLQGNNHKINHIISAFYPY